MTGAGSAANGRFFCVAVLTVGLVIGAGSGAEAARYYWSDGDARLLSARAQALFAATQAAAWPGAEDREARQGRGQAAGPADHRHLDQPAEVEGLRCPRCFRGNRRFPPACAAIPRRWACSASFRSTSSTAPTSTATRRCPTCSGSHGPVWRCMPGAAGLSGLAWLHPHADGVRHQDVELDPDGRPRRRHARRADARDLRACAAPAQKVAPQPVAAVEPQPTKRSTPRPARARSRPRCNTSRPEAANTKAASPAAANVGADLTLRTSLGHDDSIKTCRAG